MTRTEELKAAITALGSEEAPTLPSWLLETMQLLSLQIDELHEERAAAAAAAMRERAAAQQPGPKHIGLTMQGDTVVAKAPEHEPAARTLRSVLELIAHRKLGSMSQAVLEIAAHVELLEMENEDLRAKLDRAGAPQQEG